jgi:hypothetical protein
MFQLAITKYSYFAVTTNSAADMLRKYVPPKQKYKNNYN